MDDVKNSRENTDWPRPVGWRILVDPIKAKTVSDGGILLTAESQHAEASLNYVGKVVDMGPLCYQHDKFVDGNAWCKRGDYVAYGQYAGQSITVRDLAATKRLEKLKEALRKQEEQYEELVRASRNHADQRQKLEEITASIKSCNESISDTRQQILGVEQEVEHRLRLLNDDEILAVIPDKSAIRIYI